MCNPKIVRIVPSYYAKSLYSQPENLNIEYLKSTDVIRVSQLLHIADPEIGKTYIRSPYDDDCYYTIEDYEMHVWQSKIYNIANIARRLGATSAAFDLLLATKTKRNVNANLQGKTKTVNGNIDFSKEEEDALNNIFKTELQFNPNAIMPTPQAYEKAIMFAETHHLYHNNESIKAMFDMRNPNDLANNLGQWHLHIELCNDTNSDLGIAAKLESVGGISLDSSFKKAIQYEKTVNIDIDFQFSLVPSQNP